MKKILNNFKDYYYLDKDGKVYNSKLKRYIKMLPNYKYVLVTNKGTTTTTTLKHLYKLVYNKNYCIDNIKDLEGEKWKYIKESNKRYLVSNKGRIKSLCGYYSIIIKPYLCNNSYYKVTLMIKGNKKKFYIHILVADHFEECGKAKDETWQVHHKDLNKKNNNSNNLIYMSAKEHYILHDKILKGEISNGTGF